LTWLVLTSVCSTSIRVLKTIRAAYRVIKKAKFPVQISKNGSAAIKLHSTAFKQAINRVIFVSEGGNVSSSALETVGHFVYISWISKVRDIL